METPKPRGYSINDFYEWNKSGELVLQPRFQRRPVWSDKARSYLIDTILCKLPIPVIFIREEFRLDAKTTVREVVDGQQRLRAILDFREDKFRVLKSQNRLYGEKLFSKLPQEVQRDFLSYELPVIILPGADDRDVLEVFGRLNSYTQVLNAQEKRNARYFGVFKKTVYNLGRQHLEFWRNNGILTDRQIMRMGEAELTSELVVAMLDGLQDKKKTLNDFYEKYENRFPIAEKVSNEFKHIIDEIGRIFGNELPRTAFRRRALFYSLFCVFYDALYGLLHSPTNSPPQHYLIPESSYPPVLTALKKLGRQLEVKKPSRRYMSFVVACSRQTDNLKPRQIRHKFMWEAIRNYLKKR